jgi:hypothetical protein
VPILRKTQNIFFKEVTVMMTPASCEISSYAFEIIFLVPVPSLKEIIIYLLILAEYDKKSSPKSQGNNNEPIP